MRCAVRRATVSHRPNNTNTSRRNNVLTSTRVAAPTKSLNLSTKRSFSTSSSQKSALLSRANTHYSNKSSALSSSYSRSTSRSIIVKVNKATFVIEVNDKNQDKGKDGQLPENKATDVKQTPQNTQQKNENSQSQASNQSSQPNEQLNKAGREDPRTNQAEQGWQQAKKAETARHPRKELPGEVQSFRINHSVGSLLGIATPIAAVVALLHLHPPWSIPTDLVLSVLIPVHSYYTCNTVVEDYAPPAVAQPWKSYSKYLWLIVGLGLLRLTFNGGITASLMALWS